MVMKCLNNIKKSNYQFQHSIFFLIQDSFRLLVDFFLKCLLGTVHNLSKICSTVVEAIIHSIYFGVNLIYNNLFNN